MDKFTKNFFAGKIKVSERRKKEAQKEWESTIKNWAKEDKKKSNNGAAGIQ